MNDAGSMHWIQKLLHLFFKNLYTTAAWFYDFVAFASSVGQWRTWQKTSLDRLPPGRVLEIGYGTGHMLQVLVSKGFQVFGIDPSKQMTQIASRRLIKDRSSGNLARAKAQALPFCANAFHSILSTFPSGFILDEDTLREAWRVLKSDGVLVIVPGVTEIFGLKGEKKNALALLDEFASILYRITGEAINPETTMAENFSNQLKTLGFSADIEYIRHNRATVMRITAKKQQLLNRLTED